MLALFTPFFHYFIYNLKQARVIPTIYSMQQKFLPNIICRDGYSFVKFDLSLLTEYVNRSYLCTHIRIKGASAQTRSEFYSRCIEPIKETYRLTLIFLYIFSSLHSLSMLDNFYRKPAFAAMHCPHRRVRIGPGCEAGPNRTRLCGPCIAAIAGD